MGSRRAGAPGRHVRLAAAGWLRRRAWRGPAAAALLAGVLAGPAMGTAEAAACGGAVAAGSNCSLTGTLDVSGGSLTLTSPR